MQCPFTVPETWYIKFNKKDIKNISVPYYKAIKRMCGRNYYDSNHEYLEQVNLLIFRHYLAKKNKSILPSDYFILEAHALVIISIFLDKDHYYANTSGSFFR